MGIVAVYMEVETGPGVTEVEAGAVMVGVEASVAVVGAVEVDSEPRHAPAPPPPSPRVFAVGLPISLDGLPASFLFVRARRRPPRLRTAGAVVGKPSVTSTARAARWMRTGRTRCRSYRNSGGWQRQSRCSSCTLALSSSTPHRIVVDLLASGRWAQELVSRQWHWLQGRRDV